MRRVILVATLIVLGFGQAVAQVNRARPANYRRGYYPSRSSGYGRGYYPSRPTILTYEATSETDLGPITRGQPFSTRFNVDRYRSDAIYVREVVPTRYVPTQVFDQIRMARVPGRQRQVWVEPSDQQKYLSGKFSLYQSRGRWETRHSPGHSVPAVQFQSVPAHFEYD